MASIYAGTGFSSMQPDTDCPGSITMVKTDLFLFFLGVEGSFLFLFCYKNIKMLYRWQQYIRRYKGESYELNVCDGKEDNKGTACLANVIPDI